MKNAFLALGLLLTFSSCVYIPGQANIRIPPVVISLEAFLDKSLNSYADGQYSTSDYFQFKIPKEIEIVKGPASVKAQLIFDHTVCNYENPRFPFPSNNVSDSVVNPHPMTLKLTSCSDLDLSITQYQTTVSKNITLSIDHDSMEIGLSRLKASIEIIASVTLN